MCVCEQVNGEDLRNATHSCAVHALRHAATDALNLLVLRADMSWNEQELHDTLTVELVKRPSKGLGLSIVSRRHNTGIVIADIVSLTVIVLFSLARFPFSSDYFELNFGNNFVEPV